MGNHNNGPERRKYRRVAIPADDGIMGIVRSSQLTVDDAAAVNIINLSEGGLHFFLPKGSFKEINIGDHLTLKEITGAKKLECIANIELEVKWIAKHQALKHVGLGCEFINIFDQNRKQIDEFVDTMRG